MTRQSAAGVLFLAALAASPSHAQLLGSRAEATSCASAIGGSVTASHISVVCGIPPDVLDALTKSRTQSLEELVGAHRKTISVLEENLDLNRGQIRAALNIIGEATVPTEQIAAKLVEFAERFKTLRVTAAARPDDSAQVAALKHDIKSAIDRGDLAQADHVLANVEKLQAAELGRLAVSLAETSAQRGGVAMTRLRYREAAQHFAAAFARAPADRDDLRVKYMDQEANALYRQGGEFGDNNAAAAAIEKYRRILILRPREPVPLDWAGTQHNLGNALWTLGERESGTARLDEAVAAFREALKERTRERVPLQWASTQSDLGNALWTLGTRANGTARLEEAVTALREALKERTRERVPLGWALTQNNLGNALWELARREGSTARLEQAVVAYREALKEWTRERVPLGWARAQNNLGNALQNIGARESGTARLDEAVAAFREALKEYTRERAPLHWATTQNNLGAALRNLGERGSDTARLEEAVAAFREALKERTRERVPLYWATTQNNLGLALQRLGERESGTARLDEAVSAYHEALKERPREREPLDWAGSYGNQGVVLMLLAERRADPALAEQAVTQIAGGLTTIRDGGNRPSTAYYERQLQRARRLLDRLSKGATPPRAARP